MSWVQVTKWRACQCGEARSPENDGRLDHFDFTGWPWRQGQTGNQPEGITVNKEEIYDEQISPLMQNIIAVCREHGIAMIASFNIAHDGEGPNGEDCSRLTCTSHLPDGEGAFDERFRKAAVAIQRSAPHHISMHIATQHADGTRTLAAVI
ncbi:hypothetical protein [Pseudomonas putida]|uniref:Uncharacterized protein n=1 Tax=Pseudomonas putida TaxID=303 RepID=A0AAW5HJ91_PSEPU|nr:hypothetical protein [Pseudomonas putida]MCO1622216.1 hypothetical protein [Pseudomonas putida]